MLGIYVYLSDYDAEYVKRAAEAGVEYVFTSLSEDTKDQAQFAQNLSALLQQVKQLHLQLVPDAAPAAFQKLGLKENDFAALKSKGFSAVRLDYGFDNFDLIKKISQDFTIFLQASVVGPKYIRAAEKAGLDLHKIILTYDFYPHVHTGLSWDSFKRQNWLFKDAGVRTLAFVAGDVAKKGPLYAGLPTVEGQRGLIPYVAAVQLMHQANVDDVFVGDSRAAIEQLKFIVDYQKKGIVHLKCHLLPDYASLYGQKLKVRGDQPAKLVRLLTPSIPKIPIFHNTAAKKGSIVMENRLARDYSGQIYLLKQDLPFAPENNVIGFLDPEYVPLLDEINADNQLILEKL